MSRRIYRRHRIRRAAANRADFPAGRPPKPLRTSPCLNWQPRRPAPGHQSRLGPSLRLGSVLIPNAENTMKSKVSSDFRCPRWPARLVRPASLAFPPQAIIVMKRTGRQFSKRHAKCRTDHICFIIVHACAKFASKHIAICQSRMSRVT